MRARHTGSPRTRRAGSHPLLLLLLLLAVAAGGSGCASTGSGDGFFGRLNRSLRGEGADSAGTRSSAPRRKIPLRIERPEAPADYDFLVGELARQRGDLDAARAAYSRASAKTPSASFVHDRLARVAWQLEDLGTALREAEIAHELDPDSVPTRLFLGSLYRLNRDFEGLDRVLRDEEGEPLDADSAFSLFQAAFEREDFAEAESLARKLQSLEPDQLRGTLALTSIFAEAGRYAEAEQTLRAALEDFPDHFLLFMRLAQLKRTEGDKDGEIALYGEVLKSHPNHYGILQRLAQAQIENQQIEDGIRTYERIVRDYPDDQRALRRLASLEFSQGRAEAAARHLETVLAKDPKQPDVAFALGQIRAEQESWDLARAAFERIGPTAAIYADARIQIAAIHQAQGRPQEALDEIDKVRLLRDHRGLDLQAAILRIELGDFEGGTKLLESLLDGSETDAEIYYQLGVHHGTAKREQEALGYMYKVLEIDPASANALNYIGYSLAERGENLEEAESMIRQALEISPGDGYITDSLGWVYYKMAVGLVEEGRRDEAQRFLERAQAMLLEAAEITGGDAVVAEHLGDVLLLQGDRRGALEYYDRAIELGIREDEQPKLFEKRERLRGELGILEGSPSEPGLPSESTPSEPDSVSP